MAVRPKTLPASMAPVVMGTVMAFGDGLQDFQSAGVALITAILLQIGTNFANDYFDFRKGVDTSERIGPQRVTSSGFVTPKTMLNAVIFVFGLAIISSIWLILRAGWPIAVIALLAVLSGIFYTAGPRPIGYMGLGEIFVLIFFACSLEASKALIQCPSEPKEKCHPNPDTSGLDHRAAGGIFRHTTEPSNTRSNFVFDFQPASRFLC